MNNIYAVILAAGKGTRMKSDTAKVLHKANGKPLLSYVLKAAEDLVDAPYVVIGHQADIVKEIFKDRKINFILQKEQLGTGHAVMQVEPFILKKNSTVLVLNGDTPLITSSVLKELLKFHEQNKPSATVMTAKLDDPAGYGRIIRDADGYLLKIVEQKDATPKELEVNEINTGTYCFSGEDLFRALNEVRPENAQNEYYLTDVIGILNKNGKKVCAYCVKDPYCALGVNSIEQLEKISNILKVKVS